jgi:soluble lytic murein transglycosylase-like protein
LERQQSAIFHPCVDYWEKEIFAWAAEVELDPLLIATVMQIESCGNPNAVSPVGALGLFQVMPYHFLPGDDPLDPQTNAQRGLDYLQESFIKSNGDIRTTLAGYNGGHGQINRDPEVWPDETKRYVHWGWGIYQDARDNNITGKALSDWLDAGGWHLCEQAKLTLGLP